MRVLLIAALLGTLAAPTFANTVDCASVRIKAEIVATAAQNLHRKALALPATRNWQNSTQKEKDEVREMQKAADVQWKKVEMFANIYQAFCKD